MNQDEDVLFCLTWRGTILTRDKNGMPFLHESLENGIPPNAARFTLHCNSGGSKLGISARLQPGSPALAAGEALDPPAFTVIQAGTGRATYLHLGKNFAVTPENGVLLQGRPQPDARAVFIFVPEQELLDLLFIQDNQWLTGKGALIHRGETGLRRGFIFSVGEHAADLRYGPGFSGLRLEGAAHQPILTELTLLRDGWKIAGQLRLFRPLIYYAAFGKAEIFEQLRCSLLSLATSGAFAGHIHIISDRPISYIKQFVPPAFMSRLTIQPVAGMDFWDFAFARFRLDQWPQAASFQPILYVDTDIAFDRPVEPLLRDIALSGKICVVSESFSRLDGPDSSGAPLFRLAGVETGDDIAFNSGCQGFPSLAETRRYFNLTRATAESFRNVHPGGISVYGDQPFCNYVAYLTETVNTEVMDAAMRLSGPEMSAAPAERTGMVHFWPCRRVAASSRVQETKRDHMQAYIQALTAADAAPVAEAAAQISFVEAAD
jgi:hypothetical protein